jgi:hypothetical protein
MCRWAYKVKNSGRTGFAPIFRPVVLVLDVLFSKNPSLSPNFGKNKCWMLKWQKIFYRHWLLRDLVYLPNSN